MTFLFFELREKHVLIFILNYSLNLIRQIREIIFEFRSPEAQGLLLYQALRNPPPDEPKYELYVLLEGGELKTIHVFGANETTLLVGKGLNRDWWHRVRIRVDPTIASLQVQVDDEIQSIVIEGLDKDEGYGGRQHINSTLFIGGILFIMVFYKDIINIFF